MTSQTEKSGITANNLNLKYFQPIFKNLSIFVAFGLVNNYFLENTFVHLKLKCIYICSKVFFGNSF